MRKYLGYLIIIMMIFLLAGCGNAKTTDEQNKNKSSSQPQTQNQHVQEHLFEAKDMDSIDLSGQDIIDGKEANMSVKISNDIKIDFHISRDNPNGTKLYAIYNSQATNLAVNYISPDVFDNDEAIPSYYYQICCYDFNKDGIKEVVIACGNKSDKLSIFVFGVNVESEFILYPMNTILGDKNAYVNESSEICVPSIKGVKAYKYNVKAEDANYAKQSGPLKISVDYAKLEQLGKYKNTNQFVKDEEGSKILILPTETLKDVTVYTIEYDVDADSHYATNELYKVPTISPEEPLVLQYLMPDFPILGVSYVDESGTKQFCGIGESLMDGSIFLFEMGMAEG